MFETFNIFLDLEETVIDDWFNGVFLLNKITKIKQKLNSIENSLIAEKLLKKTHTKKLIIFSLAIINKEDIVKFNTKYKHVIENMFNLKIDEIVIFDEVLWTNIAKKHNITPLKTDNMFDVFNIDIKTFFFKELSKNNSINILFDDTTFNSFEKVFDDEFETLKKTNITVKI